MSFVISSGINITRLIFLYHPFYYHIYSKSSLTHSLTVLITQLAQTPSFQPILSTELSLPHLPTLSDRPSRHFTTSFIKQTLLHHPAWLPIPPRYVQVD